MSPLVSILIPAYNAERWIAAAIGSAVAQTWKQKEIIIVDDGSADATLSIAKSFENGGVKVVAQENRGASAARNNALSHSRGEYIQWLDADDLLAPDKIERQMDVALRCADPRVLLASGWGRFDASIRDTRFSETPLWTTLDPADWLITKMEKNDWMAIECWLVSRALAERAGPWNETLLRDNDGDYFSRVVAASRRVHFCPDSIAYVRRHFSGISSERTLSAQKVESIYQAVRNQIGYLLAIEDSERSRKASIIYLQNWSSYFYPERDDLFRECRSFAKELGGTLEIPNLPWKYSWIQGLFGWPAAKRARAYARQCRTLPRRAWNRVRAHLPANN